MTRPDIVAHRGGSAFPENSFAALKYACTLGVEQLEFDVHLTRDGELVIIHDTDLEQTTQDEGPVRSRTLQELANVRLRGVDEGVPAFDDVMAFLAAQPIHVRIEIKSDERPGAYARLHERIMRALRRHAMAERATVMSFELDALAPFHPDGVKTSLSFMRQGTMSPASFDDLLADLRRIGVGDIGLSYGPTTRAMLDRVARHGLTAGVWTVNGPGRLDYWLRMPVAYVLTDQPDLAVRLR